MQILNQLHAFIWESMTINNCNTYFIDGPTRILIDPGHLNLFDHVQKGLTALGLGIEDIGLIICTHAHPDHIEAVRLFKKPALIAIHEKDWRLVKDSSQYIDASSRSGIDSSIPDLFLKEGDLSVGGIEFKVFHTPGHSPGSITLYWPEKKVLFTGDLVFKEGVGRTDITGGDGEQLKESIKRMAELDTEWLLTGHGEIVSGKKEVMTNFDQIEQFYFRYI